MEQLAEITTLLAQNLQLLQARQEETESLHRQTQTNFEKQFAAQQMQFENALKLQAKENQTILMKILQSDLPGKRNSFTAEGIADSLTEFVFDSENGFTFPAYFRRFESIFNNRCQDWSDVEKVTLLLQKLGTTENTKFRNFILPRKAEELTFDETVNILKCIFDKRESLFHTRYKCFNIVKQHCDDFVTYAGKVNEQCELFKLNELTPDMFKCLIFVQGLTSMLDKDVRSRVLSIIEQDAHVTLQKVTEECQRLVNLKRDNSEIEDKLSNVNTIRDFSEGKMEKNSPNTKTVIKQNSDKKGGKKVCDACGGHHLKSDCFFKNKICFNCDRLGHKSAYCKNKKSNCKTVNAVYVKTGIQDTNKQKFIETALNGHKVKFLLDTGSELTVINEQTWRMIGSPVLRRTTKSARGVSGKKLNLKGEFSCNVSLLGKTFSATVCVLPGSTNLFGTDWIVLFDLWGLPLHSFDNKGFTVKEKCKKSVNLISETKNVPEKNCGPNGYKPGDRISFQSYRGGRFRWKDGVIVEKLDKTMYTLKGDASVLRRHRKQIRRRHCESVTTGKERLPTDCLQIPGNGETRSRGKLKISRGGVGK
ncbi:hypothetical protein Ahia01_000850300 [Argonauta hians]